MFVFCKLRPEYTHVGKQLQLSPYYGAANLYDRVGPRVKEDLFKPCTTTNWFSLSFDNGPCRLVADSLSIRLLKGAWQWHSDVHWPHFYVDPFLLVMVSFQIRRSWERVFRSGRVHKVRRHCGQSLRSSCVPRYVARSGKSSADAQSDTSKLPLTESAGGGTYVLRTPTSLIQPSLRKSPRRDSFEGVYIYAATQQELLLNYGALSIPLVHKCKSSLQKPPVARGRPGRASPHNPRRPRQSPRRSRRTRAC